MLFLSMTRRNLVPIFVAPGFRSRSFFSYLGACPPAGFSTSAVYLESLQSRATCIGTNQPSMSIHRTDRHMKIHDHMLRLGFALYTSPGWPDSWRGTRIHRGLHWGSFLNRHAISSVCSLRSRLYMGPQSALQLPD